jgi:TRAP-type C4-dicarboxylate transport system permease small subunit
MFQSAFLGLSKIANSISTLANIIGTLVVLGLVVIINYDVFARGLFNSPFRGAVEVVQFSMVLIVFLQLPDVVRVGRLTRSDGFLLLLEYKAPKVARVIHYFINLLSAAVMSLIAYAIFPEFIEMLETKDYFGIPGVFTAPWWPIKLIIFGSAVLCTVLFVLKLLIPKAGAPKQ